MQLSIEDKNTLLATEYASKIREYAPKDHDCRKQAEAFLKKQKKESGKKSGLWGFFGF
jgi:hypothetical protein